MTTRLAETIRLAQAAEGRATWQRQHTAFLDALRPPPAPLGCPPRPAAHHVHDQLRHPMFTTFAADGTAWVSDTTTGLCSPLPARHATEAIDAALPAGLCPFAGGLAAADFGTDQVLLHTDGSVRAVPIPLPDGVHPTSPAAPGGVLHLLSTSDDLDRATLHRLDSDGTLDPLPAPRAPLPRSIAPLGNCLLLACDASPTVYLLHPETGAVEPWDTDLELSPVAAVAAHDGLVHILRGAVVVTCSRTGERLAVWDVARAAEMAGARPVSLGAHGDRVLVGDALNQCVHELEWDAGETPTREE